MKKLFNLSLNRFRALSSKFIYLDNFVYFDGELFIEIIKFIPEYKENEYKNWKIEILKYNLSDKNIEVIKSYDFVTSVNYDYINSDLTSKYEPYERRKLEKIFKLLKDITFNKTIEDIFQISRINQNNIVSLGIKLSKLNINNIAEIKKSNFNLFNLNEKGYNKIGYNLLGNEEKKNQQKNNIKTTELSIDKYEEIKCLKPNPYDILEAIRDERNSCENKILFTVKNSIKIKDILKIFLDLSTTKSGKLDDDLEGCKIWWINKQDNGKQSKGSGEILSIDIESEVINVRFCKGEKPIEGTKVVIYPKEYLEALESLWANLNSSKGALNNFYSNSITFDYKLDIPKEFQWLRENQKKAFMLFSYNRGILQGPPGTGKTTALGVLIASYLKNNPQSKILLLSLTNLAVDEILCSVDKQLKNFTDGDCLQKKCIRLGSNINSEYYKDKNYLIATKDYFLLEKLTLLENEKPDKKNEVEYNEWLKKYEDLKLKMKINIEDIRSRKNLIALTTTRALYEFENLNVKKFDLIVFDEASQISLPQAIMLSQLGKQIIYAGDKEQLNPICISKNKNTKKIMGASVFHYSESIFKNFQIFLNEQSRMSENICSLVSNLFYNGELIVSLKEKKDSMWLKERELKMDVIIGNNSVNIGKISKDGTYSQKYRGFIRYESAEFISNLCKRLVRNYNEEDIVVLSPFKAQKNFILSFLKAEGLFKIKVKTVHKSQGSEYHTVIFDPVVGNSDFLKTKESINLLNVALSRAKARLVVCLSETDKKNEYLNKISNIIEYSNYKEFNNILNYINKDNFPFNLVGENIKNDFFIGKVLEVSSDITKIKILCFKTGKEKKYSLKVLFNSNGY